ncbi:MAG: hypothetical protein QM753_01805 [Thermomicrobiales bacterium]
MHRFDSLSRVLAGRTTRRSVMRTGSAAVAGGATLAAFGAHAAAQDATPAATPLASPVAETTEQVPFLFVQSASSATFAQAGDGGGHRLTLKGHTGGTIYFSDRPERVFGEAPTQQFLDGLGFSPDNPPNAAIVTTNTDGSGDVLIVELTDPVFDAASGELSYGVSALETYTGDGLAFAARQQQDLSLAADLGTTSLFIDDCSDKTIDCYTGCNANVGNLGKQGMCYKWNLVECVPCHGGWSGTADQCNETFSECNGDCFTNWPEYCHPGG